MAADVPPTWAKVFVAEKVVFQDHPFAIKPTPGMLFHNTGEDDVYKVESVEDDPDHPGRVIVRAERTS